jgi:MinD superfamily P-loop ATPase
MRRLTVVSGKGGTGKTSIAASFAVLARDAVIADCDVDAPDLRLLLDPHIRRRDVFAGSKKAAINETVCSGCGLCSRLCRFDAVLQSAPSAGRATPRFSVDRMACEGCGVCARFCPKKAIDLIDAVCGEWYVSETRCGPLVDARLNAGEENSGKLVTVVRTTAARVAEERGKELLIVDGPPGISCPTIASLSGTDVALVVTEPTPSGHHDAQRIIELTTHMRIPTYLCVNKRDLNAELAAAIQQDAESRGVRLTGAVDYDKLVTEAQVNRQTVVEFAAGPAAAQIEVVFQQVMRSWSNTHASWKSDPACNQAKERQ